MWITSKQLKETNLIFAEHEKLLLDNLLLRNQISNYRLNQLESLYLDSIRRKQIFEYQKLNESYNLKINNLNREVKRKNNTIFAWKVGGITVTTGLFLWLLLK